MSANPTNEAQGSLDYIQHMLRELREMAEAERFNMLAYLLEMAYIEANDMLRGRRPLHIEAQQGDGAPGMPLQSTRKR